MQLSVLAFEQLVLLKGQHKLLLKSLELVLILSYEHIAFPIFRVPLLKLVVIGPRAGMLLVGLQYEWFEVDSTGNLCFGFGWECGQQAVGALG